MEVQIFGVKNDSDTRKALRFFSERRIKTHFMDLKQRAASPGELKRFVQKFGTDALINRNAKRFLNLGLKQASYGKDRWIDILSEEPMILNVPLTRFKHRLTIGVNQEEWQCWIDQS